MIYKVPLLDLLMLVFLKANDPAELKPCSKEFLLSSGRYHHTPRDEYNSFEPTPCSREFVMSSSRIHNTPRDEYDFIRSRIILKKYFRTRKITEVAKSIESQSLPFYDGFPTYTLRRTKLVTTGYWPTLLSTKHVDHALSFTAAGYGKGRKLFASELSNYDIIPATATKRQRFASERSRDYIASAIGTKNDFLSNDADYELDDYIESGGDEDSLSDSSEELISRKKGHLIDNPLDSSEEILSRKKVQLINSDLIYNQKGNQMLIGKDTSPLSYEYSQTPLTQSILQNSIDYDTRINFNADKNYGGDKITSSQSQNQNSWSRPDIDPVSSTNTESDLKAAATLEDFFATDKREDEQTASNEKEHEILQKEQDSDASQYGVPESNVIAQQHEILHEEQDSDTSQYNASENNVRARTHEVLHEEQDSDTSQYGVSESNVSERQHEELQEEENSDTSQNDVSESKVKENDSQKSSYETIKNEKDEQKIPNQNEKRTFLDKQDGIMESHFKVQESKNSSYVAVKNEKEEQMVSDQVRSHKSQPELDSDWLAYEASDIDIVAHDPPHALYATNENLKGEEKTPNKNKNRMLLVQQDSDPLTYSFSESNVEEDPDFRYGSDMAVKNEEDEKTAADLSKIQIPQDEQYFDPQAYSTPEMNVQVSDPLKGFHAIIMQEKDELNEKQSEKQYAGSQYSDSLGKHFKLYDYLKNLYSNAKTAVRDQTSGQEKNQNMKKYADLLPYGILGNIYKFYDHLKSLYTKSTSTDEQKPSPALNGLVSNQHKEYILPTVADAVTGSYASDFGVNEEGITDIGYTQPFVNKSFRDSRKQSLSDDAELDEAEKGHDDDKEAGKDDDDKEAGNDDDDKEAGKDDDDKEAGNDDDDKEAGKDDDKEAGKDDDKGAGEVDDDKIAEEDESRKGDDEVSGKGDDGESGEGDDDKKVEDDDKDESRKGDNGESEEDDGDESGEILLPLFDEIITPPPEMFPKPEARTKKPRKVRGKKFPKWYLEMSKKWAPAKKLSKKSPE